MLYFASASGPVAQLGERAVRIREARGSSPLRSTQVPYRLLLFGPDRCRRSCERRRTAGRILQTELTQTNSGPTGIASTSRRRPGFFRSSMPSYRTAFGKGVVIGAGVATAW